VAAVAREEGAVVVQAAEVVQAAAGVEPVGVVEQAEVVEDRAAVVARAVDRMRCCHMQSSPTSPSCDFRQTDGRNNGL